PDAGDPDGADPERGIAGRRTPGIGAAMTLGGLMDRTGKWHSVFFSVALCASVASCDDVGTEDDVLQSEDFLSLSPAHLPNNFPILNGNGFAAAFSTSGGMDFTNEFNTPQGTNGRSCGTCHFFPAGWSIRPLDA